MKRGEIVWHVVTGPECLGLVVDIKSWKEHVYAEVHWLPGCGGEELHEDDWFKTAYLRRVGESE